MKRVPHVLCSLFVLIAVSMPAQAQKYPTRPVRLIVPFAPGGGTDIVGRTIAQKMSEALSQSVVVDNRPGAGGTIGADMAVRATPDGYTLVMVSGSYGTNAAVYKLAYDPINDIQPIAMIGESAFVVVVHPSVAAKSIAELIALAKARPGAFNYGSTGTGGITHLGTELFELMAGVKMTHVPFKGTGPSLNALLGNQLQLMFAAVPAAAPHVKNNRLRGLAVSTEKPSGALPGVPTIGETVKGYDVVLWYGVFGPKGLPKDVVNVWNQGIGQALQAKELQDRMAGEGLEPAGGTPEQFRAVIKRDVEKWKRVVKQAKITVQS
ncbi:MAG TPA: tripartite tricarboxylate transporter substrate binding protein [Burkholderiales bacterium]|nr:tripartite tricarboxylate transporter substrate binding protein [Burkholderiales bacterium]